jgi:subfamily B ATP-binding cassette protein MsbA
MWSLIRPHWTALLLAFLAASAETVADVMQPWPIKLVLDNVVQQKALAGWQGRVVALLGGGGARSILVAAVAAVIVIAVIGAVGS